jgi:hypothetical protein
MPACIAGDNGIDRHALRQFIEHAADRYARPGYTGAAFADGWIYVNVFCQSI